MPNSNLKLFRRHEKQCSRAYPKEYRIYEWMTQTQKGKTSVKDCSCSIYSEGTLVNRHGSKTYLRPRSTGQRTWTAAEAVKQNWLAWGSTTRPPDRPEAPAEPGALSTVSAATRTFLSFKKAQLDTGEILPPRYAAVNSFLNLRVVPFATVTKGLQFVQELDNEDVWKEFIRSWKCLDDRKPIRPATLRWNIGMLREFLSFCVRKEWLSDNYASKEYGVVKSLVIEPKEPFTEAELSYIYGAAAEIREGTGSMVGSGEKRAKELQAFILTMRYTGLRISDVTRMEVSQLQPFNFAGYSYAIWCNPKKTRRMKKENFVHIPIPDELSHRLSELAKTPKQGKYFFLPGSGLLKTGCQEWRDRIKVAFNRAEELMQQDGIPEKSGTHFGATSQTWEKPIPHKFRHTFGATLLQGGASVRLVGQWLGDTEETVRLHYAKFCREEQQQAAEIFAAAMRNYRDRLPAVQPDRLRLVR